MGERFIQTTTGRRVLVAIGLFMLGGFTLFSLGPYPRLKADLAQAPFPEEAVSSASDLGAFLSDLGPEGLALYHRVQIWDLLNPALIAILGLTLVAWMLRRSTEAGWRSFVLIVPMVAPLADLVENGIILAAIRAFPAEPASSAALPVVGSLKFAGLITTVLLVLALLVPALRRRAPR